MTQEQKDKKAAINRINDRYRQIVIKFGEDSAPAKQYREKMMVLAGDNMTESGYISKSIAALDEMSVKDIRALEKQPTASILEEKWRDYISTVEEIEPEKVTEKMISDYYNMASNIRSWIESLGDYDSDPIAQYRDKHNKHKGKLTYEELNQARKEWVKKSYKERDRYHERRKSMQDSAKEIFGTGKAQAKVRITQPRSENMRTQGVTNKV